MTLTQITVTLKEALNSSTVSNNIFKACIDKMLANNTIKYSFTCDDGIYYEIPNYGDMSVYEKISGNHMSTVVDMFSNDGSSYSF